MAMRSPDKWTAQQDSTRAQAHCAAAITNQVKDNGRMASSGSWRQAL